MIRRVWLAMGILHLATHLSFAQCVRVSGSTHLRYIEIRPLVSDSVAAAFADGDQLLRQLSDGRIVRCIPGDAFCYDVHPGERVSTVPVVHDIEVSGWGFARGLSVYLQLRGRTALAGADLWPRGDDKIDALAAYAEWSRTRSSVRIGRQWKVSGLGFYNFDGVSIEGRPIPTLSIAGYGGRSLVRGINEPRSGGALESIETLAPLSPGLLLGLHARYQPNRRAAASAVYQVDLRSDGEGVYSELLAIDGTLETSLATVEAAVEYDLSGAQFNEARMRARTRPFGQFAPFIEVRRYRPYFELWTIWGAFSPVGFDEARTGVAWASRTGRLIVQSDAAYRNYGDTEADELLADFRDSGWGWNASANWQVARDWRVDAGYRLEAGAGAARREAQASVRRSFGDRAYVTLQGAAFERLYEFRLEEGTVVGIGAEGFAQLSARTSVVASALTYRHLEQGPTPLTDWNQRRASLRLQWTIGPEPGMPRTAAR